MASLGAIRQICGIGSAGRSGERRERALGLNQAHPGSMVPGMAEPTPLTEADLAAVQAGMADSQCAWRCHMLSNGGIGLADRNDELVFTLSRRGDGGIRICHWHDDPEAPEAGFREMAAGSLREAIEMMRALVQRGC